MQQGQCHPMHRFMEVCLLFLLSGEDKACHGYCLADQLTRFGFANEELNISTLYRTLRHMEHNEWVHSLWESGGQGPQRRVYSITPLGRDALDNWVTELQKRRERIGLLLDAYAQLQK